MLSILRQLELLPQEQQKNQNIENNNNNTYEKNVIINDIKKKLSFSFYLKAVDSYNEADFLLCENQISKAIEYNCNVSEYFLLRGKARFIFIY